jgi:NADH dehydrogenase FAD-containing subunit
MTHSTDSTIILGGGFTGLFTALHLSHHHYSQPTILVDRQERFSFNPMLYEFLSGEMGDKQVCPRYQELLDSSGVTFVQDTVRAVDLAQRQVKLASGTNYNYKYLVLALGSTASYFGVRGAREHCFCFRNGKDAVALAKHLRDCLHRATQTTDPEQRRTLLTVAVIGAGPSGVELSATLADLLPSWYAQLGGEPQQVRVVLLDRQTEILSSGPRGGVKSELQETAKAALQQRHVPVEFILGAEVSAVDPEQIEYKRYDGTETLQTATAIWTAGSTTNPVIKELDIPEAHRDKHGCVYVTPTLQLLNFPEVFAGGDCAANVEESQPPTAQVAYQQGAAIAYNLQARSEGKELSPAQVHLRGTLLKLGLGESAASIFDRFEVTGKTGHFIRQATYLELLPTPIHNFKATTQWLVDEIFHRHYHPGNLEGAVTIQ